LDWKASFEILRPINCIMGSITVVIGILNARTDIPLDVLLINIILGTLTYFFLAGSGMIINDIYDIEIDKINRPDRPIPSGRVPIQEAKLLFLFTYGIGCALSILHSFLFNLGFLTILLAVFFGFIGWVYAKWGKKSGLPGNILVGISFSIGLIYGALLNSLVIPAYIYFFFITSFCLLMAREIVKGCEDIEGDKKENIKTLAISIGINKSMVISIAFQGLAIIFFILPLFTAILNPLLFIIFMIPGVAIIGFTLLQSLSHNQKKEKLGKISWILKVGALVGLIAFLFASL